MAKKPVLLMILDGWGIAPDSPSNAAKRARTPELEALFAACPHTEISWTKTGPPLLFARAAAMSACLKDRWETPK